MMQELTDMVELCVLGLWYAATGLPYHLCMKLIDATFICTYCKSSVFGQDVLKHHHKASHKEQSKDPIFCREFDWAILRIGGGHYEMNMVH